MSGFIVSGIEKPFQFFDAHLDQFGPQSGGYGSVEQLSNMTELSGAIRVLFCEKGGQPPQTVEDHLAEAEHIRFKLMPEQMPRQWSLGVHYRLHVEGLARICSRNDAVRLMASFAQLNVTGLTPIYHRGGFLGGCCKEVGKGLTQFGQFVIEHAWSNRAWWVDVAHMSDAAIIHTLNLKSEVVSRCVVPPGVAYTHGGIFHEEIDSPVILKGNQERCLKIERALELVNSGGLVCLSPVQPFYQRLEGPFVEHLKLLGEASDWELVGLGTDYGGVYDKWRLPRCKTVLKLFQTVTRSLLEAGLEEWQVRRVVGENVANFFRLSCPR